MLHVFTAAAAAALQPAPFDPLECAPDLPGRLVGRARGKTAGPADPDALNVVRVAAEEAL